MITENFWKELIRKTERLQIPAMQKKVMTENKIIRYQELLSEVVAAFAENKKPYNGAKIFIEGIQDNSYNDRLVKEPPGEREPLEVWGERIFGLVPYGVIMNSLELYSNELVQKVSSLVKPLIDEAGLPPLGLSMLFFMGNYGFTPFGVHKGTPGEDGFLVHLGPGKKVFYTWDTDEYNRLTNCAPSYKDIEKILPYSIAYELEPGDVMFIPSGVFHVADSPEFSMSLVLDYRKPTVEHFARVLTERLRFDDADRQEFVEPVSLKTIRSGTLHLRQYDCSLDRELLKSWEILNLGLLSNGGFFEPSKVVLSSSLITSSRFCLKKPFQLMIWIEGSEVEVYSRGHIIKTNCCRPLLEVINGLNKGESYAVEHLLKKFDPVWDSKQVYAFLAQLAQTDILAQDTTNHKSKPNLLLKKARWDLAG